MPNDTLIAERWKQTYSECGEKTCLICRLIRELSIAEEANELKRCPDCGYYPGERLIPLNSDTSEDKDESNA